MAYYVKYVRAEPPASFRTTAVKRGNLLATIGATGTVEPEEVVDVGAQVVGRIKTLGIDPTDPQKKRPIDYCSTVQEGTVAAQTNLDYTTIQSPVQGVIVDRRVNIGQNVVTYTVVIETKNPDLKLIPYLTANVQFEVEDGMEVVTGVARNEQAGDATSNPFAPQLFRSKAKQ